MSFKTFLQAAGHDLENGLNFVLKFEPAVEIGLTAAGEAPLAALVHVTAGTIVSIEQKFSNVTGNGAQKLAQAVQILEPSIVSTFAQYGVKIDTAGVQNYINAAVAFFNALPAGAAATPVTQTITANSVSVPIVTPITLVAAPASEPSQAGG